MTVYRHDIAVPRLSKSQLAAWTEVPAAVASDCLDRGFAMDAAIKPIDPDTRLVGPARTVECMVGDNSALHAAIGLCEPGDVLVCNGRGFEDNALFGGLMCRAAREHGLAGLVVDGAVRDAREIRESGFACFARAVVPRGPHKNFGGTIDGAIACAGVSVAPGDLVIGDADGVTVVPFARIAVTLEAVHAVLEKEQRALAAVARGGSLTEFYGVPEVTLIE